MTVRQNLGLLCALLVFPAAGGCTRTSDGSYVPAYSFGTASTPLMDMPTVEPTAPEADPRVSYFPPPPPLPRLAADTAPLSARRTAPRAPAPRTMQCETETPMQGRIRIGCR